MVVVVVEDGVVVVEPPGVGAWTLKSGPAMSSDTVLPLRLGSEV
jgi:hypothetical protein